MSHDVDLYCQRLNYSFFIFLALLGSVQLDQCVSIFFNVFRGSFLSVCCWLVRSTVDEGYNSSHVSVDIEVRSCRRAHPTSMGEHEEVAREEE